MCKYDKSDNIVEYSSITQNDIYYFESHRRGVNIFLVDSSFPATDSLNTISINMKSSGFVRISKWCIVNVDHISDMRARINSQIDLILDNGSIVTVNRTYLKTFRNHLKKGREKWDFMLIQF